MVSILLCATIFTVVTIANYGCWSIISTLQPGDYIFPSFLHWNLVSMFQITLSIFMDICAFESLQFIVFTNLLTYLSYRTEVTVF